MLKIVNKSNNPLPSYATEGSSAFDLRAFTHEPIVVNPLERVMIHTGLYMEIEKGYEGQIRPRSGLALNHGITVLNSPGTVDSDYRGEVCVILINLSNIKYEIKNGERIAQMVIDDYKKEIIKGVDILEDTERGSGGFGHTGK